MNKYSNILIGTILLLFLSAPVYAHSAPEASAWSGGFEQSVYSSYEFTAFDNQEDFVFPVNERGQTYGTFFDAGGLNGNLPDLIAVVASNGEDGYITRSDFLESSRSPRNPDEAVSFMEEYRRAAINAFCAVVELETGYPVDRRALNILFDEIEGTSGIHCRWERLPVQQRDALTNILPEGFRTPQLAEDAYHAALIASAVSIPVYAVDGVTIIGEFIVN